MKAKYSINYIKDNNLILFECVGGSHAYGTNTPTSDIDIRGVFICELDDLMTGDFPEQISDSTNDTTYYELGRFLELVKTNNPNILELLNSPYDTIKYKHPLFDLLIEHKTQFISKSAKNSFGGYARQQIAKAKGLNKKQNWEKDKIVRKDLLDFCYVIEGSKTIPLTKWFEDNGYLSDVQKFCGVVNVPNARDVYALYFDKKASMCFSVDESDSYKEDNKRYYKEIGETVGLGYKGITKVGESENAGESNQLRLSSIPKGEESIAVISFNKDGYSQHCKDYKEYQEWLENRNEARYVDTKAHGQKIDGKNMMHCMRLIRMAQEIGRGEGIIVRRKDAKELLDIRHGKVNLEALIDMADTEINNMDEIFDNSSLPDKINPELVNELLIKIRRGFYF